MKSLSRVLKPNEVTSKAAYVTAELNGVLFDELKESPPKLDENVEWKDTAAKREQLLRKARVEAEKIVAQANLQAAERLQQAEASIEDGKRHLKVLQEEARSQGYAAGKEEGYSQGFDQGKQAAMESLQEVVSKLQDLVADSREAHVTLLEESRSDLLKLAVAIAEKILCRELSTDDQFPAKTLDSILPSLDPRSVISIRVCPATWQKWKGAEQIGLSDWQQEFNLSIIPDETLTPGDIVVDTKWGYVDGRLQTRWQRILEGIGLVEACKGANFPK